MCSGGKQWEQLVDRWWSKLICLFHWTKYIFIDSGLFDSRYIHSLYKWDRWLVLMFAYYIPPPYYIHYDKLSSPGYESKIWAFFDEKVYLLACFYHEAKAHRILSKWLDERGRNNRYWLSFRPKFLATDKKKRYCVLNMDASWFRIVVELRKRLLFPDH